MEFKITLTNLGKLNDGIEVSEEIHFPATHEEIAAAYLKVSNNGANDTIITNYDAPFKIDQHEMLATLERIGNLQYDIYEGFLILSKHMSTKMACDMAEHYNFQIFRDVKSLGDVARQVLEHDVTFQHQDKRIKNHFDYDAYGVELDSMSEYYEDFENEMLLEIFN
ncbi:antirestriction protein ArdA [Bacillus cereus]|uniref:antirestriction protein ArdA n=1 Tax=Bacillus cereus TaxID=1396 RepID=UPI0035CA943A